MANLNYNKVTIAGKLVADPDQRQTHSGTPVTSFRVAVNRRFVKTTGDSPQQQQTADFFSVVAWQSTAEFVARYFRKGSSILVEGRLQDRQWTDQNGQKRYTVEIVAEDVYFVDSKGEGPVGREPDGPSQAYAAPQAQREDSAFVDISSDDDLPF